MTMNVGDACVRRRSRAFLQVLQLLAASPVP